MKQPQLGTGQRFSALASALADKPGVKNPQALAASIGHKKYGKAAFAAMSHKKRPY
jgi:hypothetical protein